MKRVVFTFLGLLLLATSLHAVSVVNVTVGDKEVNATIKVDNVYEAQLHMEFENVIGLTQDSISINAYPIDPKSIANLQRLGNPSLFNIPALFPIQITISPTLQSSLSFTGVVDIEISTTNLTFDSRFRLFKSPNGGNFSDITNFAGIGSYRVRGTSGDFSDFIIALDLRTSAQQIDSKFNDLQYVLSSDSSRMDSATVQSLQSKLDAARASYQGGSKAQAAAQIQSFVDEVKASSGSKIPNTYRANDLNTVNVAGDLQRYATTLIFSLRQ